MSDYYYDRSGKARFDGKQTPRWRTGGEPFGLTNSESMDSRKINIQPREIPFGLSDSGEMGYYDPREGKGIVFNDAIQETYRTESGNNPNYNKLSGVINDNQNFQKSSTMIDNTLRENFSDDFIDTRKPGMAYLGVMEDYYNPATGKKTQMTAGYSPKEGSGWQSVPNKGFDLPGSSGNKIGTSKTPANNPMASRDPKSFAQEYSVALPPTMGGYRKKDMVDLELGREGRISPFVAVGQSKQSPNLGWVNDDARGVFGGEYRPYVPGGKGGINVSIRPNISNVNTFNPQNTTSATSNPTLQTAGGNIDESTAQGGGPYTAGRDITPVGTRGTATTGDGGGGNTVGGGGGTVTTPTTPTTPVTPVTPFSKDFATEQAAKDWLNTYYKDNVGRDAKFDDKFSDASTNASYWLNNLSKGIEDKASVQSNIDLNDETWLNKQFNTLLNRNVGAEGRKSWMDHLKSGKQTRDQVIANIKLSPEYKKLNPGASANTYGGGSQENNYITDKAAYKADQAAAAAKTTHSTTANVTGQTDAYLNAYANLTGNQSTVADTKAITDSTTKAAVANQQQNTVDDWLTDFYTKHGINEGKVDQGGRDYWTKQLGSKSKAKVERDILWAAANN